LSQITFDGLLSTSNAVAPPDPQGAYTLVFRTGAVEAVASSIARGRDHEWIALPNIEAIIVKYATDYMKALHVFGIEPPIAVMASLLAVKGKHFLKSYAPEGALWQDMPAVVFDRDRYDFIETIFENVPQNSQEAARQMRGVLDHLANTAGLPESPFFDSDGNYLQVLR
jgi:hypothetical protein